MKEGWRGGDCIGRDGGGVGGVAEWKTAGRGVCAVEMRKTKRVGDRERRWRKRESECRKE